MKTTLVPVLLCITLPFAPAAAAQALEEEIAAALRAASHDGAALGPADRQVTLQQPAQAHYELGAVVDVRQAHAAGVEILAVTPGGAAARMKLKPGDRIVAINGTRFAAARDPAALLKSSLATSKGALQVRALRNGQAISASGTADIVGTPAYRLTIGEPATGACGYITDQYAPPQDKLVFPAEITRIDGRSTPIRDTNRHRVGAGQHVITVADRIPPQHLTSAQIAQIARLRKFQFAPTYKPLVINIEPNTTYRIGVRLLKDRLDTESIRANAYWEPVVWKQVGTACR